MNGTAFIFVNLGHSDNYNATPTDNRGVNRMVPMIKSVLGCVGVFVFRPVVIAQNIVKPLKAAQHRCHTASYGVYPTAFVRYIEA